MWLDTGKVSITTTVLYTHGNAVSECSLPLQQAGSNLFYLVHFEIEMPYY